MINFPANDPPAERYLNTQVNPPCEVHRWHVPGHPLLCGGNVVSPDDWNHLVDAFGVTHCLDLDSRPTPVPPDRLREVRIPDNGLPIAAASLREACLFARDVVNGGGKLYVGDCMGAARAPAFAYAILRSVFGLSHEEGVVAINRGFPHSDGYHWGYNNAARAHIGSIDLWCDEGGLGA
jgi:hypothetical protein